MHGQAAEIVSTDVLIKSGADALQLCMDINHEYDDTRTILLQQHNVAADFFDLTTGLAGEVAQKLVNYDFYAAIIGDFSGMESKSLRAYMLESNRGRRLVFAPDVGSALTRLAAH